MPKLYYIFGLSARSDFELPELVEITERERGERGLETIEIVSNSIPSELPDMLRVTPFMQAGEHVCLYDFASIARFLVEDGRKITVQMYPDGQFGDMRTVLLGEVMGTLLHMRRLVPLHVSAVVTPDGLVAFGGPSGAGKSTTAAQLYRKHGWKIFCDDVAVLDPEIEAPLLHSGITRLKLWRGVIHRLGFDDEDLQRDFSKIEKYHILCDEIFFSDPCVLSRLFILKQRDTQITPSRITGREAVTSLLNLVHRPISAKLFNDRALISSCICNLCKKIEVWDFYSSPSATN